MPRKSPDLPLNNSDAAMIERVRRFAIYLREPGTLRALRFLYRHRVISRTEWLLVVWTVGSKIRSEEPALPEEDLIALIKETFDAHEVDGSETEHLSCPYPSHAGSYWRGHSGRLICGVCHPPADPSWLERQDHG